MTAERVTELITMATYDGYLLQGKLDLPAGDTVDKLVYFVNSSGPHTYDNHRLYEGKEFNYYDLFAEELHKRGIALFRHNTRGVTPGLTPPMYADIDQDIYKTYLPENSIRDVEDWLAKLRRDSRLKDARVILLGWSEGTMIAPAVALRGNVKIDGLLLAGYVGDTMDEVLDWQQTGGSSMVFYGTFFDYDGDGAVTKAEFDEDRHGLRQYLGAAFERLDVDRDGRITRDDFRALLEPAKKALYAAIEAGDDRWLAENYPVRLTTGWFYGHRELPPNRETLPKLSLPIHIFHGKVDQNVSYQGALDIEAAFRTLGKDNLRVHVYDKADHDLNYMKYIITGEIPKPIADLFKTCEII